MTDRRPWIARMVRRKLFWTAVTIPLLIAGACVWLTEPLEEISPGVSAATNSVPAPLPELPKLPDWPTSTLDGQSATELLLASLREAKIRLEAAGGYSAVMRKTERLKGRLGSEQVLDMKCRHVPFSVYFKFRTPETGKEVVYSVGHYDDHVIAHGAGLARFAIPRLKVPPTSPLAMAGNRHPITDAGLLNLTNRLIGFREMDLKDPEARTVLDRIKDEVSGCDVLRSVHSHPHQKAERPFQLVEVLYDAETRIPIQIKSFDWPAPGETGDPKLAEAYRYDELKLGIELNDADFDPRNPAYAFSRF